MKKLFTLMFLLGMLCPLFAEPTDLNLDINVEEIVNEYNSLINFGNNKETGNNKEIQVFGPNDIEGDYTTSEMVYYLKEGYGPDYNTPSLENHITSGYRKVEVVIPGDYYCNAFKQDGKEINGITVIGGNKIGFINIKDNLIFVKSKEQGKSSELEEISFKLDYYISFTDRKDKDNSEELLSGMGEDALKNRSLTFTFKYSPEYFTFKRFDSKKKYKNNISKSVEFDYNGKTVTLNTEVYAILITSKSGKKNTYFVLEPNFQNLYKDFEFVRNGKHKSIR